MADDCEGRAGQNDGAARGEPSMLGLSRVATEFDLSQTNIDGIQRPTMPFVGQSCEGTGFVKRHAMKNGH